MHAQRLRDHEMLNVLAGASALIDLLEHDDAHPNRDQLFRVLGDEVERMRRLVSAFDQSTPPTTVYDAASEIDDLVLMYTAGVARMIDVAASLPVHGSPSSLRHALVNVLLNCARHAPGSAVLVRAEADEWHTRLFVEDDGPTVPVARTTGSGVGLAFSRRLLAEQGATLEVAPRTDAPGWSAVITLPTAVVT